MLFWSYFDGVTLRMCIFTCSCVDTYSFSCVIFLVKMSETSIERTFCVHTIMAHEVVLTRFTSYLLVCPRVMLFKMSETSIETAIGARIHVNDSM